MNNKIQGTAGFYIFTVSLLLIGAIITVFGVATLFSGQVPSPHLRYLLWITVATFFSIAMLALVRLLLDISSFFVSKCKPKKL